MTPRGYVRDLTSGDVVDGYTKYGDVEEVVQLSSSSPSSAYLLSFLEVLTGEGQTGGHHCVLS